MIRSFRNKALAKFFQEFDKRGIRPDLVERLRVRLRVLHAASSLEEMNVPGFKFHGLQGSPKRYSIHVNGPWCLTFEWEDDGAYRVDLEQYH